MRTEVLKTIPYMWPLLAASRQDNLTVAIQGTHECHLEAFLETLPQQRSQHF
jgi:hypothetical protein